MLLPLWGKKTLVILQYLTIFALWGSHPLHQSRQIWNARMDQWFTFPCQISPESVYIMLREFLLFRDNQTFVPNCLRTGRFTDVRLLQRDAMLALQVLY